MAIEVGVWRIDGAPRRIETSSLALESRLEDLLERDISIASPNWMVIGRQVRTPHEKFVDLLAIDVDGNLVVLELKRDKTPRNVVAQLLDYGSWVRDMDNSEVARIFSDYWKQYHPGETEQSIDDAFRSYFDGRTIPDELNTSHELVIVAASLDPSSERMVGYLADEYGVAINAVFFQALRDGDREYLARAWLRDPQAVETPSTEDPKREWNGEYYVSFGTNPARSWEDAVRYGFVSGGGKRWYSNTLSMLSPGSRIWVNIPGNGYVGVGEVLEPVVAIDEFIVSDTAGRRVSITQLPIATAKSTHAAEDPDRAEHLVKVRWLKTVPEEEAIREKGFFGNQNTVARPRTAKRVHTVNRLKTRFGIS